MNEIEAVREAIIEEQAKRIAQLEAKVAYWSNEWETEHQISLRLSDVMRSVINRLAVSTCVEVTHRTRNKMARDIVALLVAVVNTANDNVDDIPF